MLAKTPLSLPRVKNILSPYYEGGRVFLPGYHRTKEEKWAASILLEHIQKSCPGSLYGRGFYMTRTFWAQTLPRMQRCYGDYLVRCRVEITGFICLDKSVARRVWGHRHTLVDQLLHYGPFTAKKQKLIDQLSQKLDALWSKRGLNREYSSDIAKTLKTSLSIHRHVPGLVYTGRNDGPCVLAYKLDRVKPLTFAHYVLQRSYSQHSGQTKTYRSLTWRKPTDQALRYILWPQKVFKDSVDSYGKIFKRLEGDPSADAAIRSLYAALPDNVYARGAFCYAALKRDNGVSPAAQRACVDQLATLDFLTHNRLKLPYIKNGGSDAYPYYEICTLGSHRNDADKILRPLINTSAFRRWTSLIRLEHALTKTHESLSVLRRTMKKGVLTAYQLESVRMIFCFYIDDGGMTRMRLLNHHKKSNYVMMDMPTLILHYLQGQRDRNEIVVTNRRQALSATLLEPYRTQYLHGLYHLFLTFYAECMADKTIKSRKAKTILKDWYTTFGVHYREVLRTHDNAGKPVRPT